MGVGWWLVANETLPHNSLEPFFIHTYLRRYKVTARWKWWRLCTWQCGRADISYKIVVGVHKYYRYIFFNDAAYPLFSHRFVLLMFLWWLSYLRLRAKFKALLKVYTNEIRNTFFNITHIDRYKLYEVNRNFESFYIYGASESIDLISPISDSRAQNYQEKRLSEFYEYISRNDRYFW